jgi:hypothetical protein
MLKTRMKRLAARGKYAAERPTEIETSIIGLGDEDILDLADIFRATPDSALGKIVQAEMTRRNIRL